MAMRSRCPPTSMVLTRISAPDALRSSGLLRGLEDVCARRLGARGVSLAPERFRRFAALAGPSHDPVQPVIPPGAGLQLRPRQPLVSTLGMVATGEELRLGVPGRIDDALDMATRAQDELARAAQHLDR